MFDSNSGCKYEDMLQFYVDSGILPEYGEDAGLNLVPGPLIDNFFLIKSHRERKKLSLEPHSFVNYAIAMS